MVLNEAAQILLLLHTEELRELQTKIHEIVAAVQVILADPETKMGAGGGGGAAESQTKTGESWRINILGFQLFTSFIQLGTMYAPACIWKSNATFSREGSQEIEDVLEVDHHCFFFYNVQESGGR